MLIFCGQTPNCDGKTTTIDRVVDIPAEREPGDAEDSGSCCTKCCSDVKETIERIVEVLQIQCQGTQTQDVILQVTVLTVVFESDE